MTIKKAFDKTFNKKYKKESKHVVQTKTARIKKKHNLNGQHALKYLNSKKTPKKKNNISLWNYYKGLICEFLTIIIYTCMLYRFRGWRVKNRYSEIDLVFSYGELWVFIEVKYRKNSIEEGTLSKKQIANIKQAAQFYLIKLHEKNNLNTIYSMNNIQIRFDFVAFSSFSLPTIYYNI